MKQLDNIKFKLMALPMYVKVLIVFTLILFVFYMVKPNAYKRFYKLFNKELEQREVVSKKVYDSIERVRRYDRERYAELIKMKDMEIDNVRNELLQEKQRAKRYAKELDNYRRGDFDERFIKFTSLVRKDSI